MNGPAVGDVDRQHPRLQALAQVIDYALSKPQMYVIVNTHHEKTLKTEGRSAVLERLWADIADIFAERDYRLIFEILNEPHRNDNSAMPPETLRDMTGKAYAKIRAVDAARLIVIGGNRWFGAAEMAVSWPDLSLVAGGQDPFVMATFHHCNPWSFCGDNQGTYDHAWTEANLSDPMDVILTWANDVGKRMPILIGEWGRLGQPLRCHGLQQHSPLVSTAPPAPCPAARHPHDRVGRQRLGGERFNAGCR